VTHLLGFARRNRHLALVVLLGALCAFAFSAVSIRAFRGYERAKAVEEIESQARAYESLLSFHITRLDSIVSSWSARRDLYSSVLNGNAAYITEQFNRGVYADLSLFAVVVKRQGDQVLYGATYQATDGTLHGITPEMRSLAQRFDVFAHRPASGFVIYGGDVYFSAAHPIEGSDGSAAIIVLQRYTGVIENSVKAAITAAVKIRFEPEAPAMNQTKLTVTAEVVQLQRVLPDVFDNMAVVITTEVKQREHFSGIVVVSFIIAFLLAAIILGIYTIGVVTCINDHKTQKVQDAVSRLYAHESSAAGPV